MTECSICQSEIKDKINMSCTSQHMYCFGCILKSIEVTGELRSCPLCNGGGKFIIIGLNSSKQATDDYYSLYLFGKSLPVIKNILKDKTQDTCIISEKILQFYVSNKTQLEFFHTLNKDYEADEIIKYIKWDLLPNISSQSEIGDMLMEMAGDFLLGGGGSGTTGAQRQPTNGGNARNGRNVVYTFTAPNPFSGLFNNQ